MPWTFEQRLQRACDQLVDRDLLEKSQIVVVHRPLFFGQFAFGLSFTPVREQWYRYIELKEFVISGLDGLDYHLQSNQRTLQFNIFSSDTKILRWLIKHQSNFMFNHLRRVDPKAWHLSLPKPRPKMKFYGQFGWRIAFKDPKWCVDPDNLAELDRLSGTHKLVLPNLPAKLGGYLYLDKLSDVLMFKLMHAEDISNIEDRSSL